MFVGGGRNCRRSTEWPKPVPKCGHSGSGSRGRIGRWMIVLRHYLYKLQLRIIELVERICVIPI